jgi:hypothetical protein
MFIDSLTLAGLAVIIAGVAVTLWATGCCNRRS